MMMSAFSSSHDSGFDIGPPEWQPRICTKDRVVTSRDSTLESEEVAAAVAEGIILPRDQEHLEGLLDDKAISLSLSISVRVSILSFCIFLCFGSLL